MTATLSPKGQSALEYAKRGWSVFPLENGTKDSLLAGGWKDVATDDPKQISTWWAKWPEANIGLNLAKSGLVAVDADTYKPDCEFNTHIAGLPEPNTYTQRSARGGSHYVFTAKPDEEFPGQLCKGVEIKHKGYIMLAPSTFDGGTYEVTNASPPAQCPDWVPRRSAVRTHEVLTHTDTQVISDEELTRLVRQKYPDAYAVAGEPWKNDGEDGGQYDWSDRFAFVLKCLCEFSADEDQIKRAVMGSPMVTQSDAKGGVARTRKANRIWAKEYRTAREAGDRARSEWFSNIAAHSGVQIDLRDQMARELGVSASPDRAMPTGLITRSMAEVTMTAIEYVWKGWVPKGYLTLIAGETGAAKTTVVADIAARISTGAPWPNETEHRVPARVLWLGSEDGMEDMTVPRLNACHANLHNIIEIQGVNRDGLRNTFSLQDDIQNVAILLQGGLDAGDPFGAIVIDPITSYLSGSRQREVKMNDAGQLRSVLEPWLSLAQKFEIAIICITHLAKDTNRTMLHRVLGSAAFAQTCRSLIAVVDRKTDDQPWAKAMAQVKMNLPDHPGGSWLFETKKVDVGTDPRTGKAISATKPEWEFLDPLVDVNNLVASSGAKSERNLGFALWISQYFRNVRSDEGVPVSDVKDAAVKAAIVSKKQWERISPQYLEKRNIAGVWYCRPKETVR